MSRFLLRPVLPVVVAIAKNEDPGRAPTPRDIPA